jgi:hypothetical protein
MDNPYDIPLMGTRQKGKRRVINSRVVKVSALLA